MSAAKRYAVWCQGHIDYCRRRGDTPHPLAHGLTWNEAQARKAQATRECAAEAEHFIEPDRAAGSPQPTERTPR